MPRSIRLLTLALVGVLLSACAVVGTPATLGDALDAEGLTELKAALADEGLLATLEDLDAVTIFAPVDAAFASGLSSQQLADVLTYHAVAAEARSTDLVDGQIVGTLFANSALGINVDGGVTLNDGSGNTVTVTTADIEIANGVIHKIDTVLTPPGTIVEVATAAGFSTLLEALTALNLAGSFDGDNDGPLTVFAPTNAAFDALLSDGGYADLDALVADLGAQAVTDILLYHVVDGRVGASDAVAAASSQTPVPTLLTGVSLNLSLSGGNVVIANGTGNATVTGTNVVASNGVIHVVDQVLLPPSQ